MKNSSSNIKRLIQDVEKLGGKVIHQNERIVGFEHPGDKTKDIASLGKEHGFFTSHSGLDGIHTTTAIEMNRDMKIKKDLKKLTKEERKIYDSVMSSFPATQHESAMDVAIQGGVNWQFISK